MTEPPLVEADAILVVKLSSLGDVVHSLPALAALRHGRPDARIGWAVEEEPAPVLRDHPAIDRLHVVPRRRWARRWMRPGTIGEILDLSSELREEDYDVALDLQGLARSAVVCALSGARRVVGPETAREGATLAYDHAVDLASGAHAIDRYILLARTVGGVPLPPESRPAPLPTAARREARSFIEAEGLADRPFAVVLPGAGKPRNRWGPPRWAAVLDRLAAEGVDGVLAGGPKEGGLAREVARSTRRASPAISCGVLDIPGYRALVAEAGAVVGSDTGPVHLAAADGCPVVAIFGAADPRRTGPRGPADVPVRVVLGCRVFEPCCKRRGHRCMDRIRPDRVGKAVLEVVRSR